MRTLYTIIFLLLLSATVAGQETSVRIGSGRDATQGSTTDSAVTGDNSGTISAKIRGLNKVWFSVWDSVNNRLNVNLTNSTLATTQSGAWSVSVSNFPASQAVTGTFWQATQPVSGTFWQATQPVSGPLTDTQLRASAVPVSGTFFQSTQPISAASLPLPSGASTSAKQPALGTAGTASTDVITVQGIANGVAQPVSGTVTANAGTGTFTVSGTVTANAGTGTLAVSGPLTDTQLRASAVPVSGTFFQATQPVSVAATITTKADTVANQTNPMVVTLGNIVGKTNILKTGTLASSATTADQVVLTYTVTAGKTFFLQTWDVSMGLTTPGTTAIGGSCSLESPAGTKLDTNVFRSVGHQAYISQTYAEPVGIAAGTVIRFVCTPAVVTATTWAASLAGFER